MPHISRIMGIPLGKPDIYDKKSLRTITTTTRKCGNKPLSHTMSTMSKHVLWSIQSKQNKTGILWRGKKAFRVQTWSAQNAALFSYHWPDRLFSSPLKSSKQSEDREEKWALSHLPEQKTWILHCMKAKRWRENDTRRSVKTTVVETLNQPHLISSQEKNKIKISSHT